MSHRLLTILPFLKNIHFTFTLHVYDMTLKLGGGGDGGGLTGEEAANSVITVPDCIF